MFAGNGQDQVYGGLGADDLHGGGGDDWDDLLLGGPGDDTLQSGNGNDDLVGGINNDQCYGGSGANTITQCEFGAPDSCNNGVNDGTETGVDCGGACFGCGPGGPCEAADDCATGVCSNQVCTGPSSSSGDISANFTVQSDWGDGYCVQLWVTNTSATPVNGWTVSANVPGANITGSWEVALSANSGDVDISAPAGAWNETIAAGATIDSMGFCTLRDNPNSGLLPVIVP